MTKGEISSVIFSNISFLGILLRNAERAVSRPPLFDIRLVLGPLLCHLALEEGQDEGADALEVVPLLRFEEIVLQGAIPVGVSTKAGDGTYAIEVVDAILVDGEVDPLDPFDRLAALVEPLGIEDAESDTLEVHVGEHRAAAGLQVVADTVRMVGHLVPHAAFSLEGRDGDSQGADHVLQLTPPRMVGRGVVEDVQYGHAEPADGA